MISLATIRSVIQVTDGMSPALKAMQRSLSMVITSFEDLQNESAATVDIAGLRAARDEINKAGAAITEVEERQRKLNNQINQGQTATSGLSSKFKGMVAAVGTALGAKAIIGMADGATLTMARLDLMNDGLQTTEELQQKIFHSAQRSRAPYEDTAQAVTKLGILAKDAFNSNDEMILFAELMNKQFKIGGSSVQEQTSAMYQLTQAMAAGKLQGDEFRSIMENAPMLAQSLAKELGVSVGELKEMSADGLITADIIKNAMFSAAEETNKKFAELPMTFEQLWTVIINGLQNTFMPLLLMIGQGAQFISDNWSTLAPIFLGLAAAVGFYSAAMGVANVVTWLGVEANRALAVAMLSNPIGWIALAIGFLIGHLYRWVKANGGVKTSLMVLEDKALFTFDALKWGLNFTVNKMLDGFEKLRLGTRKVGVAIENIVGATGVGVLKGIEWMVNGAIDLINFLINSVNKIPGVSIGTIDKVTFGTESAIKEEAKRKARAEELDAFKSEIATNKAQRDKELLDFAIKAGQEHNARLAKIDVAKAEAAKKEQNQLTMPGPSSPEVKSIDANTKGIKDSVDISAEDLKYMRDIAEQEVINRFTTAEIKVDMKNDMNVSSSMDLDGVVAYLEDKLTETLNLVAEGVPEGV